jgi:parallel beta-helix repeat protein
MVTVGNNAGVFADNNAADSRIGGETTAARNIISGNNVGISLSNSGGFVRNFKIQGNRIGPDAAGGAGAPNGIGIWAGANSTSVPTQDISNIAIDSNVISHNGDTGIKLYGAFVRNNLVAGNTVTQNGRTGVLLQHGANNNVIGGLTAAARNVISGNTTYGIAIDKPTDVPFIAVTRNTIQGNFIGTDAAGSKPDPNGIGILVVGGTNNLIGGTDKGAANTISGNTFDGVAILEPTSKGNVLQGNFIGTIVGGGGALGNGLHGIEISVDAVANVIGARVGEPVGNRGNVIAFNGGNGVAVGNTAVGLGLASVGNTIRGNAIYANSLLGIDLGGNGATLNDPLDPDSSPNNYQNFPELLSAIGDGTTITFRGTLNSTPNQKFVIDVYGTPAADPSGHGEGQFYLGSVSVVTNAAGLATFTFTAPQLALPGWAISATATRVGTGDTSEFSKIILLT